MLTRNIVTVIIILIIILAMANEAANGVNFSLVPHCNPCEYKLPNKRESSIHSLLMKVLMASW